MSMTRRDLLSRGLMLGSLPLVGGIAREEEHLLPGPDTTTVVCDLVHTLFGRGMVGVYPEDYAAVLREPGPWRLFSRTGSGEGAVLRVMEEIAAQHAPLGRLGRVRAAIVVFSGNPSPLFPEVAEAMEIFHPVVEEGGSILFNICLEPEDASEGLFYVPPDPGTSRVSVLLLGAGASRCV